MTSPPSRRSVLATLGTVGLAGCLADGPGVLRPDERTVEPPDAIESDWPAPGYDHRRTNATTAASGPTERVGELWTTDVGTDLAGPVVADGKVLVGGADGVVRAFDARTGAERWTKSVGTTAGPPRIVDGTVFAPTRGAVVALDLTDGTELWRRETPGRHGLVVAPHGLYTVGPSDENGQVVGRGLADGAERWRTELDGDWTGALFASGDRLFVPVGGIGRPWSLDVDSGETPQDGLLAAEDGSVARCYRDGAVVATEPFFGTMDVWDHDAGAYDQRWGFDAPGYSGFRPAAGPRAVYVHAEHGEEPGLYALSLSDGERRWDDGSVGPLRGRPVVAADAVVVNAKEGLRCFDPGDGTERWQRSREGVGREVALVDDLLYTAKGGVLRAFRSA